MKTIEVYDEDLMNTCHVVINHIVRLRETSEKATRISLTDSNNVLVNKPLKDILELIKDA